MGTQGGGDGLHKQQGAECSCIPIFIFKVVLGTVTPFSERSNSKKNLPETLNFVNNKSNLTQKFSYLHTNNLKGNQHSHMYKCMP